MLIIGIDVERDERTEWQPITLPGEKGRQIYIEAIPGGGREEVGLSEAISSERPPKI